MAVKIPIINYDLLAGKVSWKAPVRVATTTNATLATGFTTGTVIDGVALTTGDRLLIKDQNAPGENGVYTVTVGAPTRTIDFDADVDIAGFRIPVLSGTVGTGEWVCTNTPGNGVVVTNTLTFAQNGFFGTLPVSRGGTSTTTFTNNGVLIGNGTGAITSTKQAPGGSFVGDNDSQTLSNKLLFSTLQIIADGNSALGFAPGGTASFTTTVQGTQSANRALVFPDKSGILAVTTDSVLAAGAGNVTDRNLSRWSGTGGQLLINSVANLSDAGALTGITQLVLPATATTTTGLYFGGTNILGVRANSLFIGGSGNFTSTGASNVFTGVNSGITLSTGAQNVVYGPNSLPSLTTGTGNAVFGYNSATAYTGAETNNLLFGNGLPGTVGESNVIRLGNASHTNLTTSAVYNAPVITTGKNVVIDSTGRLTTGFSNGISDYGCIFYTAPSFATGLTVPLTVNTPTLVPISGGANIGYRVNNFIISGVASLSRQGIGAAFNFLVTFSISTTITALMAHNITASIRLDNTTSASNFSSMSLQSSTQSGTMTGSGIISMSPSDFVGIYITDSTANTTLNIGALTISAVPIF